MGDGGTCEPFNTPPTVAGVRLPPRVTRLNSVGAVAGATWDAEGDPVTLEWEWKLDGVVVPGVTGPSIHPPTFSRGQLLTVTVTPFDGRVRGSPASAPIVVSNAPPPMPTVAFAGPSVPGQDLFCAVTSMDADADGDAVTHRFTWMLNGITVTGVTVDASTSRLPGTLSGDGGWIECQADPYGGYEFNSGRSMRAFFDSPCIWTEMAWWPLNSLPAGSVSRNGAYAGQGLLFVGGRTAWAQQSDWNQLFVPSPALASDGVLAVSVDMYWTAGSRMALGQRLKTAGYNDIIRGYDFSYDGWRGTSVSAFAPTSTRNICCSPPVTTLGTASVSELAAGTWHRVRVEHRESTQRVKGSLNGLPALSVTGTLNWGGSSIKLDSGRPCCSPGRVAFSELKLERGTAGCFKGNGDPCTANGECASGYCVSGVCCSSGCTGANQTCTRLGSVGTCVTQ